jgi:hypothetical protein
MAQYSASETGSLLKEVFDSGIHEVIYPNNPLLGMVKKTQTGGSGESFVVRYENSGGRSRDIAKSLARKKPAKFVKFTVTPTKDYNSTSFDRLFMNSVGKSEYAFLESATKEIENLLKKLSRSLASALYRNSGGGKGTVGSFTSTTITMSDIEEIANFGVGDILTASANDGSTSTDTLRTGTFTVTLVNRDTGVLTGTFDGGLDGTITAADTLFEDGDFQQGISGLQSWCPGTAPGSTDSFLGANRSVDVTRLAGVRVSALGDVVSEAIMKATARLGREGAMPDTVMMSHTKMRDLLIELGSKVEYEMTGASDAATVGFKGVRFVSPNGTVTCYADHNCPSKRLFVLKKSALELLYVGSGAPELQDDDGSVLFREAGSDSYEARASYYANLKVGEPNEIANVQLES